MLSADLIAATQRLLETTGIAVAWSAAEELRPGRVIRLPAAAQLAAAPIPGSSSVVVKVADDGEAGGQGGAGRWALHNEWAALTLLDRLASGATPRLLAADLAAGVLVLEDLGDGPSLATLLLGDDSAAAAEAARRSAASLGALHAASIGSAPAFTALRRRADPGYDPEPHRLLLRGRAVNDLIAVLPGLLADHDLPPLPAAADDELAGIVDTLADPGPFLVLSNGDPCPDNERVGPAGSRFFDFEVAGYRHALADAAHYRLPFPNCWCWRRLPAEVASAMETAYRTALATACPDALDDTLYQPAMARITTGWLLWTLRRSLPLAVADHGARQRVIAALALSAASATGATGATTPAVAGWARACLATLGRRWPESAGPAPTYPAFGGPPFGDDG